MVVAAGRLIYPVRQIVAKPRDADESMSRPAMTNKLWYLKRCDLFERLTPEQAEHLEGRAVMRRFGKGEIIYVPSDLARSVLVVASGRVKIKGVTPDGKEIIYAFIEPGELFGELALVDESPRDEFAEALEPSEILAIARDDLFALMAARPDISLGITKLLGLRRKRIETRLRNIMFRSNRQRVLGVLLELLDSYGEQLGPNWQIQLRLSHQELASLIGATRETVTIVLGQLQLEGLIRVKRRCITVLDRDRLIAESHAE
jgi:CRP/FNR family transcriptional regulator, cyclic AMP receptor protein